MLGLLKMSFLDISDQSLARKCADQFRLFQYESREIVSARNKLVLGYDLIHHAEISRFLRTDFLAGPQKIARAIGSEKHLPRQADTVPRHKTRGKVRQILENGIR